MRQAIVRHQIERGALRMAVSTGTFKINARFPT